MFPPFDRGRLTISKGSSSTAMRSPKALTSMPVIQGSRPGVEEPGKLSWTIWTTFRMRDSLPVCISSIPTSLKLTHECYFYLVWISPISQNYQGPRTPYGDPYHGYWIADAAQLNDKFGTADDLKALSDEIHRRGMYVWSFFL